MEPKFKNTPYLKGLSKPQAEAVQQTEGPVLIVAGAGAGKTRTISYRILHLIKSGVSPEKVLAVTFTNKAAKEMRERVSGLLQNEKTQAEPFVSTFHALGVFILRNHGDKISLPNFFAIYDKADTKKTVKEALIALNFDPKQYDPGNIQRIISKEKGNFVSAEDYAENAASDYFKKIVAAVWQKYEKILKDENALDFDDLLLKTANLLKKDEATREYYQNKWSHVHIDEYQDTNKVQYYISKILSEKHNNICVVGDADQNIYSWRGADISNILNFEKHYPKTKIILLEENYRSTKTILETANKIIKKNKFRIDKNLFTKNPSGEKIGLYVAFGEIDEAAFIAAKCKELVLQGVPPKEIAVLYRANFQSRVIEEAFLTESVPYDLIGVKFFERKEVKDVIAFIRVSINSSCKTDLKRIANIPPRGIGKMTLEKFLSGNSELLSSSARAKISLLQKLLEEMRIAHHSLSASKLIKFVIEKSGIEQMYKKGNDEDLEKLENIGELITLASKYDWYPAGEGIERLLTDVALASEEETSADNKDVTKLMTVHAAKGLEFDYVFITGLEENLFPHRRLSEKKITEEAEEEERRLFYVALTRARKKVYLSYTERRTVFGAIQVNTPSEYLYEVDARNIEREADNLPARRPILKIDF